MGIRVAVALIPWHTVYVSMLKIDAPLAAALSQAADASAEPVLEVSVRTRAPLTGEQAAELGALGIPCQNPRRTIFPARLSAASLRALAQKPWVVRVSLTQQLRPLAVQAGKP